MGNIHNYSIVKDLDDAIPRVLHAIQRADQPATSFDCKNLSDKVLSLFRHVVLVLDLTVWPNRSSVSIWLCNPF